MKILGIADEESKYLWDYFSPEKLRGIDVIVSCGDLSPRYLGYLATMSTVPLLYVHGNHDDKYATMDGCGGICLEDTVYTYQGIRFAGLGGSYRYREGLFQFTEAEMKKRAKKLRSRIERAGGIDVLVTHVPPKGLGDLDDLPHRGFEIFRELMETYHPAVLLHGHIHMNYASDIPREQQYGASRIINAYERYAFEVERQTGAESSARRRMLPHLLRLR
jgi:Icc-related predicted phosphoesterase